MLGPNTGDELPTFNGWAPPALRSEVETFTENDANIVLDGDGTGGHGYHRSGLGIKPDEFPPRWGESEVVDLTNAIFDRPSDGTPGVRTQEFSVYGTWREVPSVIRVRYEENTGWRIATVYPYDAVRWGRERKRLGH
ncbi:hypothetical protein [Mycobacterium talmoniae]|uniref:Bacterial EndoU nuclease domain-containing protein n=1 Tax=Mycobacterium talmoniae TaxID=1858794 RepID=A0A2S8BFJ4_9MYCO|nr:hypothetical protein [Mycobacterium talmoniae]PQM45447.1 hypothetical protein C1Y40_04410 [Mycobacterium talmoniae]